MKRFLLAAALLPVLLASQARAQPAAHDAFHANLRALCGQSFGGRLASPPTAADAVFQAPLVVEVRCTADQVRMPLAVGADRSRTWVVTRTGPKDGKEGGLTLKHDHRHADGTEDALSQYGGATAAPGTAQRQDFPADVFSKDLFTRQNLPASIPNVWALEVRPGRVLAYELNRPGRHVRLEFDLTRPL